MPITHIKHTGGSHSGLLGTALSNLENGLDGLKDLVATMALMLNGDGTLEAHFTAYIISAFGFTDAAGAKAAWDELNALHAKLTVDTSVTNVHAALQQAFNKFR